MKAIDLQDQVILVTGGAGHGVGAGVCHVLNDCGAKLIVNAMSQDKADQVAAFYRDAVGVGADISKPSQVEELFRKAREHFGTVTGLVNNAGIGLNRPSHEASVEDFDRLYGVNVRGLWLMSRAFARQLLEDGRTGNIVNISSVHAHSTMRGFSIYASTKSAVEGLTRGMAVELGKEGIRVNTVSPGYVHADQNYELIKEWTDDPEGWVEKHTVNQQALPHLVTNTDCGDAVAFLISDLSRSICGQSLYVDNGQTSMLYNHDIV